MGFFVLLFSHQTATVPETVGPDATTNPYRDRDVFAAIVQALEATTEFSEVRLQPVTVLSRVPADRNPLAVVIPRQWHEEPDSAPGSAIRRVGFLVSLVARGDEPCNLYEVLDRLEAIVANTLDGSSLGGRCLGAMTRLHHGRYDDSSRHPELRLDLDGEFSYPIPSPSARCVAP